MAKRKKVEDNSGLPPVHRNVKTRRGVLQQQLDEKSARTAIDGNILLKESAAGRSGVDLRNQDIQSSEMDHSVEETLMVFFDTHGTRDPAEIEEDKLTFLEAAYAGSVVRADVSVPTQKLYQAFYHNIQENQSPELTMGSFQLLLDLEERIPQIATVARDLDASGDRTYTLDVDKRVWSPLEQSLVDMSQPRSPGKGLAARNTARGSLAEEQLLPLNLFKLVEVIAVDVSGQMEEGTKGTSKRTPHSTLEDARDNDILGQYVLLQQLVGLVQKDFNCRLKVSTGSMNIAIIRESYLYRILNEHSASERRRFLSNLVYILNPVDLQVEGEEDGLCPSDRSAEDREDMECLTSLTNNKDVMPLNKFGWLPTASNFTHLAYALLFMVMEIHTICKNWSGSSRRKDRFASEDLVNIFSYPEDLEVYLQSLDSPQAKLMFIVDYFVHHTPKGSVVKGLENDVGIETMEKLIACFAEDKAKKFVHKFKENVLPLLLSHAFQAFIILHAGKSVELGENLRGSHQSRLVAVCQALLNTLTNLRDIETDTEMLQVAKSAMGMAESIVMSSRISSIQD